MFADCPMCGLPAYARKADVGGVEWRCIVRASHWWIESPVPDVPVIG